MKAINSGANGMPVGPGVSAVLARFGLTELPPYKLGCPICAEIDAARQADALVESIASEAKAREAAFLAICPPEMAETDVARLPSRERFQRVLAWRYGARGLVLHGNTGLGKTRSAWALLRRLSVDEGRRFIWMSSFVFSDKAVQAFRAGTAEQFINRLSETPILFLDDLGKSKITLRVGEALFEVIDRRTTNRRPTIITTNSVGDGLASRFEDAEAGSPAVRRLRDYFDAISF